MPRATATIDHECCGPGARWEKKAHRCGPEQRHGHECCGRRKVGKKRTAAALKSATATSAAAPKRARAEAPGNTRSPVLGKLEAAALAEGDDEDPVAKAFRRVDLLRKHHVACLRPGLRGYAAWMNDEVLNFVLHARLLQSRLDTEGGDAEAPAWVHSTLFYSKLMQEGYNFRGVRRWLRCARCRIMDLRVLLIPINHGGNHWVFVVAEWQIRYYDKELRTRA